MYYTLRWKACFLLVKVSNLDLVNVWCLELLEQMIQCIVFAVTPPPPPSPPLPTLPKLHSPQVYLISLSDEYDLPHFLPSFWFCVNFLECNKRTGNKANCSHCSPSLLLAACMDQQKQKRPRTINETSSESSLEDLESGN